MYVRCRNIEYRWPTYTCGRARGFQWPISFTDWSSQCPEFVGDDALTDGDASLMAHSATLPTPTLRSPFTNPAPSFSESGCRCGPLGDEHLKGSHCERRKGSHLRSKKCPWRGRASQSRCDHSQSRPLCRGGRFAAASRSFAPQARLKSITISLYL